ncbi:MAG TPA: sigma-70 family RNA polymerase sigma factor, partial [Gemmataceae bacterium]|nr:sigma-70 family RNA polymerase sigma factor [Gemmataceae bacterium]
MAELPTTRPSLLVRLRDARDIEAWRQFVQLYGPVVYAYGRRRGLQDADAADLTQEVLRAVSTAVTRLEYDRQRGSFGGWLFTVAHHKLHDLLARQRRPGQGSG